MSEAKFDEINCNPNFQGNEYESKVGFVQVCICVILWSRPSTLNFVVYLKVLLLQSVKAHRGILKSKMFANVSVFFIV